MAQPSKSITVLHIDSDQAFLEVSKNSFSTGDFKVDSAPTAKLRRPTAQRKKYDVIISAYYLNDTNRIEYLNRLKLSNIKSLLVLFTVHDETAKQASKRGCISSVNMATKRFYRKLCQILQSVKL